MSFELKERDGLVFIIDGMQYTRAELKKMIQILKDLSETNDYEWPYRGPDLQSRAVTIIGKSKR